MPHPISYPVGTQDDDQTRSIDLVHIEPSIREGVHLVSSLYGPLASAPLYRYPPINIFPPYITGDPQIPNVLTCNSGQWDASPATTLFYQWMSNGADIPGATSQTWLTTEEYDNTVITCEVRGWNYLGEAYVMASNSVAISLIEPVEIWEQENYYITGLHQGEKAQTNRDTRTIITSGTSAPTRQDVQRSVAYFTTGMAADQRQDINGLNTHRVTGLHQTDTLSVLERDIGIAVVNHDIGEPLEDNVPQAMNLKNPDAEAGTLGWNIFGAATYGGSYANFISYPVNFGGADSFKVYWFGGVNVDADQANTPYSYLWQDVPVFAVWETDVDLGNCFVQITWSQYNQGNANQGNIRVEYYAANDSMLGFDFGPGLWASPGGIYFRRSLQDNIPANTRYIRVFIEWNLQEGEDNDTKIDNLSMVISKGIPQVSRSFGPNFEQWRLRFTRSNTWSGGAVSEIEMRDTPGTIDLCTGGSPIFGSAGLGVTNADAAFDDAKNTNYWAGAENSITEGTSWLGYNFGTPVKPGEIEITARPGSDALQVPNDFYLEGSDDGIRWTPVQYIDEELHTNFIDYNSSESKTILIPDGPIPLMKDAVGYAATWKRNTNSSDNIAGKGMVFECYSRININALAVLLNDQASTFNYRMQLARINTQKNGSNSIGMVSEPLETVTATSPGLNGDATWVEHVLSSGPYSFEVGDLFLIYFFDDDAATNPEDANEGRTFYLDSWNGMDNLQLRRVCSRIAAFTSNTTAEFDVGDVSEGGSSNTSGRQYAVDFRGSIF